MAAGRVRVAVDSLDTNDIHIKEAEQHALAEQALEQFEQKQEQRKLGSVKVSVPSIPTNSIDKIEKLR